MDDVVPGVLQRLREADIITLAGLASASLGQEYCRRGYLSTTRRQGALLSGIVAIPASFSSSIADSAFEQEGAGQSQEGPSQHFAVTVEVFSRELCDVACSCGEKGALICVHAAALLYQWVVHSDTFFLSTPAAGAGSGAAGKVGVGENDAPVRPPRSTPPPSSSAYPGRHVPFVAGQRATKTVDEILAQFGLSDLRALAREYGNTQVNVGKQQLLENMLEILHQPEVIRRVVGTLEKPQRQLLAACALAGGSLSDEDLRGLFERFSLGNAGKLADMLVVLQKKLLLVRASFHHLHGEHPSLDISWYIPQEVRDALHITLPVTPFNVEVPYGKGVNPLPPVLHLAEPGGLWADLLLVARLLDGFPLEMPDKRRQRGNSLASAGRSSLDGSLPLFPPAEQPTPAMLEVLRAGLTRPPARLRFIVHLLRLAGILAQEEENGQATLRVLPHAAQLLLGPARRELLYDLFTHWLGRSSYIELFELAEQGLRVRCRATPLSQPDLRRGELEQENSEARQELVALLAQVPAGEWINFAAFARFVYRLHPSFLQRRQHLFPSPHWWIEQEEGHPLHPAQLADWLKAEGRYLAALLRGPLHWWGLCDLALARDEQLLAFRLTSLASFLLHGSPPAAAAEPEPSPAPALTVSTTEHLLIPAHPAHWPLLACVERFAESQGVENEKLCYRLTARSLSEAIEQGQQPGELLKILADFATSPMVRELLTSLERRLAGYGRVRLYTGASLLQAADATVMQRLAAITSLDEQTIRPVQPTLLLLKKAGVERLLEELKRRGQLPLVHEEE